MQRKLTDRRGGPRTRTVAVRVGLWMSIAVWAALGLGCALHKKANVAGAAALVEDVARASNRQTDLRVIREGMPAYLMLMDGMIEAWPDNDRLLIAAAQAYASFASAFVAEDDAYRSALLGRSKRYALEALALRGIEEPLTAPFEAFEAAVQRADRQDLPFIFWAGSCWGNWAAAHMSSIEAMAELPRVEALMRRALALDEGYYHGGPHLFMGIWYAARPRVAGGSLERARAHFEKALELGQGKFLMAHVTYAEYYARKAMDRELFTSLLEKALATPAGIVPELTLLNTVAHQKAARLLEQADEFF
ncbi:MAG TPA: TRAP transporter TatT component family protein [Desulfosarcina sp.]|nr:TRAP transporter TatT component family protein [Desulfosarcina sp.]